MEFDDIKRKIRMFILGIFGILVTLILIRLFLIVIGANDDASFVKFWNDQLTQPFVFPFVGVYPDWYLGNLRIETASFLGIFVYLIIGLLSAKIVSSFLDSDPKSLLVNIIDSCFKVAEFLLLFRFLLRLTGASTAGDFSRFIFDLSFIVYEPFEGILPAFTFGPRNDYFFETSTLIAVVIIIVLDIVSESVFRGIFGKKEENIISDYSLNNQMYNPQPQYYPPAPTIVQTPQQQPQTNINITMAPQDPFAQPVQPRQTVQVHEVNNNYDPNQPQQVVGYFPPPQPQR